jgi:hypothetical protein
MHNPDHTLMGATQSSLKEVSNHKGEIEAGLAVHLKSDDTLSVAKADGGLLGISLGKDLSDIARTAIVRKGLRVPLKLTAGFNPTIGAVVSIDDTTGAGNAAGGGKTAVNAVYASGRLGGSGATGGVAEGATGDTGSVGVALIDFPGGL